MYFSLFKGKLLAGRFLKPKGCICFLQVPLILKVFVMTLLSKPGLITFSQFFCPLKTSYFATVQYVLKDKFSKQAYAYIPPPDKLSSTSPLISTVKTSKWSISTSCCRELPHMLHNYSDWQLHLILGPTSRAAVWKNQIPPSKPASESVPSVWHLCSCPYKTLFPYSFGLLPGVHMYSSAKIQLHLRPSSNSFRSQFLEQRPPLACAFCSDKHISVPILLKVTSKL